MTPPPTLQQLIETIRQDAGSDDAIVLLTTAAAEAAQIEDTTNALLGHYVDRCRRDGRSWSEISAALGVTKQAVHKRFASTVAAQLIAASPEPTLERFTPRARNVLAAARQAALDTGYDAVSSQHILLGLFTQEDGLAARALTALSVSQADVRAAVPAGGDRSQEEPSSATDLSNDALGSTPKFTADGERALEDTLAVALELGHNYIGTEHMLLGLYRNEESLAARILADLGAREDAVRAQVTEMLRGFEKRG